jgi:hypothetical protein
LGAFTTHLMEASPTSVHNRHHAAAPHGHKCSNSRWKLFTRHIGPTFSITAPFLLLITSRMINNSLVMRRYLQVFSIGWIYKMSCNMGVNMVMVAIIVPDMYACQNDEIIKSLYSVSFNDCFEAYMQCGQLISNSNKTTPESIPIIVICTWFYCFIQDIMATITIKLLPSKLLSFCLIPSVWSDFTTLYGCGKTSSWWCPVLFLFSW